MRIVYMGTPEIAAGVLQEVINVASEHADVEIVGVYTQPDKPVGRKQILTPSAVKVLAMEHELGIHQPRHIKRPKTVEILKSLEPDLILVTAYGQILSQEILDIPRFGCINMHTSLLPKLRGAAPIQWAVVNGDTETGVTAMYMDAGMDTGDIIFQRTVAIEEDETADTLYQKLTAMGASMTREVLEKLLAGEELPRRKQEEAEATYAPIIVKENGLIDWTKDAHAIDCQIRGFAGWPGAYTMLEDKKLEILKAAITQVPEAEGETYGAGQVYQPALSGKHPRLIVFCGDQKDDATENGKWIEIRALQLQGKKPMEAEALLRGYQETIDHLG